MSILSKSAVAAATLLLASFTTANAQEHVWKHGILEAKADSGIIGMVASGDFAKKHGLKVELTQIKAGATLMKALVAGEIDSVDMGAAEAIVAGARGTGASRSSAAPGRACRRSSSPRIRSRRRPT